MTAISDILQGALDAAFELQGIDATYTPVSGSPVTVKVIPSEEDELVVAGTSYTVASKSQPDPRKLIWRLDVRTV